MTFAFRQLGPYVREIGCDDVRCMELTSEQVILNLVLVPNHIILWETALFKALPSLEDSVRFVIFFSLLMSQQYSLQSKVVTRAYNPPTWRPNRGYISLI
jgi:hypothetical protein